MKVIKPASQVLFAFMLIFILSVNAWGAEQETATGNIVPCGILDRFEGEVQLLDASRSQLLETKAKSQIPCGSWISVQSGWAHLQHRQGFLIKMGPATFLEIFDNINENEMTGEDHVVLYRGKVYLQSNTENKEFRVATSNARARLKGGAMLVIYNQAGEETQLTSIQQNPSLENRFEPERKIDLKPGETTVLNFQRMRVVPETPRATKVTPLKTQLADLALEPKELKLAVESVTGRTERKIATDLGAPSSGPTRAIASKAPGKSYERYPEAPGDTGAHQGFINRLIGEGEGDAKLMYPQGRAPASNASEANLDPALRFDLAKRKKAEEEKKRLIEELKNIRVE